MKVLLIHLPYYKKQFWNLPLGLAYLGAALLKAGYEVDILDIHLLVDKEKYSPDLLRRQLKENRYLFIGFGAVFFHFGLFKDLAGEIRKICPDTFQVAGGQWASRIARTIVDHTAVDAVVLGEAEEVIVQLADRLREGRSVKELRYVHTKQKPYADEFALVENLDDLPFPARHLFDMGLHKTQLWAPDPLLGFSTILGTRGCPGQCVFCKPIGGHRLRSRSPGNIIAEMKELYERYRIKYFRFNDEGFLGSSEKVIAFCDALERSGLKFTFSIWSWSQLLNEKAIRRLKEAGCNRIQIGIESGSPFILRQMNKPQDLELVKKKVRLISDHGMTCGSGFITGTPGETFETLQETKNFIKELYKIRHFTLSAVNFIKILPGTPLYELARQRGFGQDEHEHVIDSDRDQMFKFYNLTKMSDDLYSGAVNAINWELKWDFYLKDKMRFLKRLLLMDQIDFKGLSDNFSCDDILIVLRKFSLILKSNFESVINKLKSLINIIFRKNIGRKDH